jgi:hypothetical protein
MATRDSLADEFSDPTPLGAPLNSMISEAPGWLSDDNCRLYFMRVEGDQWDLWVARRADP